MTQPEPHRATAPPGSFSGVCASRAGYSLIEILTVLTMVGILVAIAYPRLDLTPYRMGAATQALNSTLLSAQRLAVMKQHDVVVAFDVAGKRIRVHLDGGAPSDATHAGLNNGMIDAGEQVTYLPLESDAEFGMGGRKRTRSTTSPMTRRSPSRARRMGCRPSSFAATAA